MDTAQGQLVDLREYGRRARAARILAGFDAVKEAVVAVEERTGAKISARQMYAIERGEVPLLMEWFFAIAMAYNPPGGLRYWEPCYASSVVDEIYRRIREHVEGDTR